MTQQEWETIERILASLSAHEKQEVVDRILHTISADPLASDRASQQCSALSRLCEKLDALPADPPDDGLTNRDHDRILNAWTSAP